MLKRDYSCQFSSPVFDRLYLSLVLSLPIHYFLGMYYIQTMNVAIEFNPSAFKHGITEAAIRYAIINVIYDDIWDEAADKHLLLGFDNNGNPLEIMYNVIDEQTVNVFHAMKCQSSYYHLLDTRNRGENHAKNDR